MSVQETEAFILRSRDAGEADRWISFYAKSGGRLTGLAKGARRSRRRFLNVFEPCSLVHMEYREKRSVIWIEACKLLDPQLGLREHVGRWTAAGLICELVLELVPEGETEESIFHLLNLCFWNLAQGRHPLNTVLVFLFRLMAISGYMQSFSVCDVCSRKLRDERYWAWDPVQGSLRCASHGRVSPGMVSIDLGSLLLIEKVRKLPMEVIWRLQFSASRRLALIRSLLGWVSHHTGKGFASMKVVEQLDWV